jgi:hypothetical protein
MQWVPWLLPLNNGRWNVKLATHVYLKLRLRMHGAVPLCYPKCLMAFNFVTGILCYPPASKIIEKEKDY